MVGLIPIVSTFNIMLQNTRPMSKVATFRAASLYGRHHGGTRYWWYGIRRFTVLFVCVGGGGGGICRKK